MLYVYVIILYIYIYIYIYMYICICSIGWNIYSDVCLYMFSDVPLFIDSLTKI